MSPTEFVQAMTALGYASTWTRSVALRVSVRSVERYQGKGPVSEIVGRLIEEMESNQTLRAQLRAKAG